MLPFDCVIVQPESQHAHGFGRLRVRRVEVRLVVEIEHGHAVGGEGLGDRRPEVDGVILVGHRLLAERLEGAGRVPVKIDDREEAVGVQRVRVRGDGGLVGRARVHRAHAVDAEPAVLVERQADGVDVAPRQDRLRHRVGIGSLEDRVAAVVDARVLAARVVHAEQARRLAAVRQVVAHDDQPRRTGLAGRGVAGRSVARAVAGRGPVLRGAGPVRGSERVGSTAVRSARGRPRRGRAAGGEDERRREQGEAHRLILALPILQAPAEPLAPYPWPFPPQEQGQGDRSGSFPPFLRGEGWDGGRRGHAR